MTSIIYDGDDVYVSESGPAQSIAAKENDKKLGFQKDLGESLKQGSHSVTIRGNEVSYNNNRSTLYTAPTEGVLPGILSTAKTSYGQVINDMTQIKPDSRLSYMGTELEVSTAVMMGLLARSADGTYYEPGAANPANPANANQTTIKTTERTEEVVPVDFMAPEQRNTVGEFKARVGSSATDAYFVQVLGHMIDGKDVDRLVEDFSMLTDADPDSVYKFTQGVVNELFSSGLGYLEKRYGADPEAVLKYVTEKCSKRYQASLLISLYHNHLGAADELMQLYKWQEQV